jgi:hypothetical protein
VAYVHVPQEDRRQCYQPTEEVMRDEDRRDAVLEQALSMFRALQRRFEHLGELKEIFAVIDKTAKRAKREKAATVK